MPRPDGFAARGDASAGTAEPRNQEPIRMRAILPLNPPASPRHLLLCTFVLLALLAAAFGGAWMMAEQAPAATAAHATARKTAHPRKKPIAPHAKHAVAKTAPAPAPQAAAAVKPPAPEMPLWPANEKAAAATVTWDSHGLRIEADNSSLRQILKDVAAATGAKVSGLDADERVFGSYGPGSTHDVLSQLLHGSEYNILMTGDQGQGTPREITLTSRRSGGASAAATSAPDDDDDDDDAEEPPEPPPSQRPGNGLQRRTPLQMQQQMRERQPPEQEPPPENPPE
jgi:hypothetical protein